MYDADLRARLIRVAKDALHDSLDEPMNSMGAVVDAVLAALPTAAIYDSLMEVKCRLLETDGFTPTEVIRNALLHIEAYEDGRARPPAPGSKTAAEILQARRAAGLNAADLPQDHGVYWDGDGFGSRTGE